MRYFINELKQTWGPVKAPLYFNRYLLFYGLKNIIRTINDELVVFIYNLKINYNFVFIIVCTICASVGLTLFIQDDTLTSLLEKSVQALFGLVSVFITAAIFIATLSSSSTSKQLEENAQFVTELQNSKNIFKDLYKLSKGYTDESQKWAIMSAHAAESVFDQGSYMEFRDWYRTIENDFSGGYNAEPSRYPFDIAVNSTIGDRWPIKQALMLLETDTQTRSSEVYKYLTKNKVTINKLKSTTGKIGNSSNGFHPYGLSTFIGPRFARVLFYSFLSMMLSIVYLTIYKKEFDVFPSIYFHADDILRYLVISLSIGSLLLCIRYLLYFVRYLSSYQPYISMRGAEIYPLNPEESSQSYNYYRG